jgi:hypothetical protein
MAHHSHLQPRGERGRFIAGEAVAQAVGSVKDGHVALAAALAPTARSVERRPQGEPGRQLAHDVQHAGAPAWSLFGVRAAPEPLVSELDRRRQELSLDVPDPRREVNPYDDAVNRNQRRNR